MLDALDPPLLRPTMTQRQILQRLRTDAWRPLAKVSVSVGDPMLARLVRNGWMEMRGEEQARELRLTDAGLDALRAKIPR